MKLIKSAITFKATIPTNTAQLIEHLDEFAFTECGQLQLRSVGFVPPVEDGELVEPFPGGLAFRVRIDDKIVPSVTINAELDKEIKAIQLNTGRKVGKKEKKELRERVLIDLAKRALVKTTASVTCFYDIATGFLIIATGSKNIADICVTMLIKAVGSVKTETIHVSDVKHGLTTRLGKWLYGDDVFGEFQPCDEVVMTSDGRKVSVKMASLQQARLGLDEAMKAGFGVKSIGFHFNSIDFRLTDDFQLKSIVFTYEPAEDEEDNYWAAEAAIQIKTVAGVITELVELLSYVYPSEA